MSHKMLTPFIVKVSVLGYFPLVVPYRFYLSYHSVFIIENFIKFN